MRYLAFPCVALGLALLTLSCSSSTATATKTVSQVVIRPSDTTVTLGQTAQLRGSGLDDNNDVVTTSLTWTSSDPSVLTVDGTGHISTLVAGSATVTASVNNVSGTAVVTVSPPANAPIIGLGNTGVTFSDTLGGDNPTAQTVTVTNTGGGTLTGLAIGSIAYGAGASGWLAASVSPTTAPATVTLTATLGSLAAGSYTATVPVTSSVTGVSPQNIAVTLTISGATIVVNNLLVEPVTVYINGVSVGTVSAQGTGTAVTSANPLTVSYSLIQPTTTQGVAVGEAMSGVFKAITSPSGTITFDINNVIGSQEYFAPLITNNGANPILMAVNWGTVAENRCNCEVSAGGANVHIGYYRLFNNTEVAAFGVSSGYGNGVYSYWLYANFGSSIASGSGAVSLTNNSTLSSPVIGAGAVAGEIGTRPRRARAIPSGPVYDHALPNPHS